MSRPTTPRIKRTGGRAYWVSDWYTSSGRRRSKSFGPADRVSEAAACRAFTRWLAEHMAGPEPAEIDSWSVDTLCKQYLEHAATYYRRPDGAQTSEPGKVWQALDPLCRLYGEMPAAHLRPRHVQAYLAHLIGRNLARTTINGCLARVKRTIRWGVQREAVPPETRGWVESVEGLKEGRSEAQEPAKVGAVNKRIMERTAKAAPPVLADMMRLQWITGMRPQDVVSMRTRDIDTATEPWLYVPKHHKTAWQGRERRVYLGPAAREIVARYLRPETERPLFSPIEAQRQRNEIAVREYQPPKGAAGDYRDWHSYQERASSRGVNRRYRDHYTTGAYRQAVHHACDRASVPRWSPNQLRHAAKDRLEREQGMEAARLALGQASINATQHYGERDWAKAAELMERLG